MDFSVAVFNPILSSHIDQTRLHNTQHLRFTKLFFFIVSGKNSSQYTGVYFAVALFLLQMSPHLVDMRMTCLTIFPIPSNI